MAFVREAIKCSLIQSKSTKRSGTLRRKTKVIYGEPCWVVLCVHDNKIPCLEWYRNQESIKDHKPFKVLDLLFATYVNSVLSEQRTFIIGFSETEPIELTAADTQTSVEWVEITTQTLRRLDILAGPSNIYEAGIPKKVILENGDDLNEVMDLPVPAPILAHPRERHSTVSSHVSFNGVCARERPVSLKPPPLPPRGSTSPFSPRRFSGEQPQSESIYNCLSPNDEHAQTPQPLESPVYGTPRNEILSNLGSPSIGRDGHSKGRLRRESEVSQGNGSAPHSRRQSTHAIYDTISPVTSSSNVSSSPMQSTLSTNSLCSSSSLSSELRLSSIIPPPDTPDFDSGDRNGYHHTVKYVSLNLSIVVEHVLFVEVAGRVWVAGWSDAHDKQLCPVLNIGDELVEVEGRSVLGMAEIPQLFYTVSNPGTPISMMFRPIPFGMQISLIKPIQKTKHLGILFHKHKNRISEVVADSSAARRGVPVRMTAALHELHQSSTVVTDVAGRRLNPFSKNDQFFSKLDEVREGSEFTITLHPHDFVKELKQQIAAAKHYKVFLAH